MNDSERHVESAPTAAPDGRPLPSAFGRYELLKLLAVGGMAEVFLARSRVGGIDKQCVIKRVLPRHCNNREFISMFIDEARITIGLDHDNIVQMFDFGQVDGAYFMALEYVDGCDLVDVLRACQQAGTGVPPSVAAYVACQLLRGLQHAHQQTDHLGQLMGIVHRDVSPQNIFLGRDGVVKIGDFGVADSNNKLTTTAHGTVKGKFGYMSPEQTRGLPLDGRSDVFAVGVVLWEALVGARLFACEGAVPTMMRVQNAPILAPSELRPDVAAELDGIVLAALRRALDERTASAALMADALEAFLSRVEFSRATFVAYLRDLNLQNTQTRLRGASGEVPGDGATVALPHDPVLRALHLQLRKDPTLWTLVDIGRQHAALHDVTAAVAATRTAAAVFVHRGLLVPAICALHLVREHLSDDVFVADLRRLAELRNHDRRALLRYVESVDGGGFFQHVRDADPTGLGKEATDLTRMADAPLFARLLADDFAQLAAAATLQCSCANSVIVREGDAGDCMFAIGRGAAVVYGTAAQGVPPTREPRVYVAALSEGDFFGEFSLLTRRPRSASVSATTDVVLLRIDRAVLDMLSMSSSAGTRVFTDPLVEFYRERVAELVLVRNPAMAELDVAQRRRLCDAGRLVAFKDGQLIVKEGDAAREVFFVVAGEVEVYHDEQGFPVFLDKLRDGEMFGEMSAMNGGPRTASVRAIGDVDVMVLEGATLAAAVKTNSGATAVIADAMAFRHSTTKALIEQSVRIFSGV